MKARKSLIVAVCGFFIFLVVEPFVTGMLEEVAALGDDDNIINKRWLALLVFFGTIAWSAALAYKRSHTRYFVAANDMVIATFLMLLYAYYRLWSDFDFWPSVNTFVYGDLFCIPYFTLLYLFITNEPKTQPEQKCCLHLDDAQEDLDADKLQYATLAKAMFSDLATLDLSKKAYSVGVSAPWGIGKSTFLNFLAEIAKDEEDYNQYIVIKFWPRSSCSVDAIQGDFFQCFTKELGKYHSGVHTIIRSYSLDLGISSGESFLSRALGVIINMLSASSIEDVNNIIKETGRRLLVVIEDLDRLTAPEILEIFKLVDRNGSFVNTIFLTAYDKAYVNEILARHLGFECKDNQAFTDKYFNFEYTLPQPSPESLRKLLSEAILELLQDIDTEKFGGELGEDINRVINNSTHIVTSALNSLRHVKRFSNIFVSRYKNVYKDVSFDDFFLLTLLRYKDTNAYNSLVTGTIVQRGGMLQGTKKMMYLHKDHEQLVEELSTWKESSAIIGSLFPKQESLESIQDAYNHVRYASAFHLYFYDYKDEDLRISEIEKLYKAANFEDVTENLNMLLSKTYLESFLDYINSRRVDSFANAQLFERHLRIVFYCCDDDDVTKHTMCRAVFLDDYAKDAIKKGFYSNIEGYKNAVKDILLEMAVYRHCFIGSALIPLMDSQQKNLGQYPTILSDGELADLCLECQRIYYKDRESINYTYAIRLACIPDAKHHKHHKLYDKRASLALHNLLIEDADKAVSNMTHHFPLQGSNQIGILLLDDYHPEYIYPIDDSIRLKDFTTSIKDEDIAFVFERMCEALKHGEKAVLVGNPSNDKEITQRDFALYRQLIKETDWINNKEKVKNFCLKADFVVDYATLASKTKVKASDVAKMCQELANDGLINKRLANLPNHVAKFRVGDFVQIRSTAVKSREVPRSIIPILYRVKSIEKGKIKLEGRDNSISLRDIVPIPIDGTADKDLRWDPVVVASFVGSDGEIKAVHRDDGYWLDAVRNSYADSKSLYDLIIAAKCAYVHEAQHIIEDNGYDAKDLDYRPDDFSLLA